MVRQQLVSRIHRVVVERAVGRVLWVLQCEREREGGQWWRGFKFKLRSVSRRQGGCGLPRKEGP
jgi:hypothetical protein